MSETLYVLVSSEAAATALSAALGQLAAPEHTRSPEDVPVDYSTAIVHAGLAPNEALAGEVRLPLLGYPMFIHKEADEHILDPILSPYVGQDVLDSIAADIKLYKGRQIPDVAVFAPDFWKATAKNYETMLSEGYFA